MSSTKNANGMINELFHLKSQKNIYVKTLFWERVVYLTRKKTKWIHDDNYWKKTFI